MSSSASYRNEPQLPVVYDHAEVKIRPHAVYADVILKDAAGRFWKFSGASFYFDLEQVAELAHETLKVVMPSETRDTGPLKLDTDSQVFFYEQDHYYLSNFSAFKVVWGGLHFDTSEHAYQWAKFPHLPEVADGIRYSESAHDAFKRAELNKDRVMTRWPLVKVDVMRSILRAKAAQHEYVRRKLLQTGDRELIENSWRDPFWGWGPKRDGQNMLGKLWMEIRAELRRANVIER